MSNSNEHLRLLGTVWADERFTAILGYVIIDTREQLPRLKTLTVNQTRKLLEVSDFENAAIESGKLICTECSIDRLPKYDQYGNILANGGYMITARIIDNKGATRGFRLVTSRGEVLNVTNETLLKQVETSDVYLINAKTIERKGAVFISAIRFEFKEIELGVKQPEKISNSEHSSSVTGRTNTPEAHANYLNKLISKVATKGILKGDYALRSPKTKDYKIFYKEFLKPRYPELAHQARNALGWTQIIATMLLIADGVNIPRYVGGYMTKKPLEDNFAKIRVVARVKSDDRKANREDIYYKRGNLSRVTPELIDTVRQYDTTGDVVKTLILYNAVYDGVIHTNEPVRSLTVDQCGIIQNPTLRSFAMRLINEQTNPPSRQKVSHYMYDTENLDYFTEDGIEKLGLTLNPGFHGSRVDSPLFKPVRERRNQKVGGVQLRYVFNGVDLTEEQEMELADLGTCYGDYNIFRMLADLQDYRVKRNPDESKLSMLLNFYVYVLAVHNKQYAKVTTEYLGLGKDILFNIDDIYQATNRSDKLLYHSGLRFGTKAELVRGESFSGAKTNYVPKNTKLGFTQTMEALGVFLPLPENGIPRISNTFSYWT